MNIGRRDFLVSLLGTVCAGPLCAAGGRKCDVRKIEVSCGLKSPFGVLHISDSHLTLMTSKELEDPLRAKLLKDRMSTHMGKWCEQGLADMVDYAKAHQLQIVHTGDLIDFVGEATLGAAGKFIAETGAFVTAGNHEWAYHMYTKKENQRYLRELFLARLCEVYRNDLDCSAKVMGNVNFVQFDNWDYQITEKQNAFLRAELGKGLPTALLCHCPIVEMLNPPPKASWRKLKPSTSDALQFLQAQENLKVVLCGHRHCFGEARFSPAAMQYVVGSSTMGAGYEVTFT